MPPEIVIREMETCEEAADDLTSHDGIRQDLSASGMSDWGSRLRIISKKSFNHITFTRTFLLSLII